jgi:hypothetical protein
LDIIGQNTEKENLPVSVGDYFEDQFEAFLATEADEETRRLKAALYRWHMAWERVDNAVEDLKLQVLEEEE